MIDRRAGELGRGVGPSSWGGERMTFLHYIVWIAIIAANANRNSFD